jgi:hypothetical protein
MKCDVGFLGVPASPPSHLLKFETLGETTAPRKDRLQGQEEISKRNATAGRNKNAPPNFGGAL